MSAEDSHDPACLNLQKEEIDVLENIYLDEIEIVRSTAPYKIKIECRPYLDHSLNPALEQYAIRIDIELPKNYPKEFPILELDSSRLSKQEEEKCHQNWKKQAAQFQGQPMVFELVESLRGWIQDNVVDPKLRPKRIRRKNENQYEYLMEEDSEEDVANLQKKETYTPVTKENFVIWKQKFDAEMRALRKEDGKTKEVKLTGRQLFEMNKGLIVEEGLQDEDEADVDYELAKANQQQEEEEKEEEDDEGRSLFYFDEDAFEGEVPEGD